MQILGDLCDSLKGMKKAWITMDILLILPHLIQHPLNTNEVFSDI